MTVGEIQDRADETLLADLTKIEELLIAKLIADLGILSVDGTLVFSPDYFAGLEGKIVNYMAELGYTEAVNKYLSEFDAIDEAARTYYSRQRILLENEAIQNPLNEELRKTVIENLKGSGVADGYIKELATTLRQQALQGQTISQATDSLLARVSTQTQPPLTRYVGQVTQDAIMQYDGAINLTVKNKYGLKKMVYINSVIETTRPCCDFIRDKFGSRPFTEEELKAVLDEFIPNGVPSEDMITYTTVNGETFTKKKGAGMIKGTNLTNFIINRGGYNCRHEVRFVFDGLTAKDLAKAIIANT